MAVCVMCVKGLIQILPPALKCIYCAPTTPHARHARFCSPPSFCHTGWCSRLRPNPLRFFWHGCVSLGILLQPNTTAFVLRVLRNETQRQPWRGVVVFESEARAPAPKAILSRAWVLSNFLIPLDFEITESGLLGAVWTLDAIRAKKI